jgi:hypothetical protein
MHFDTTLLDAFMVQAKEFDNLNIYCDNSLKEVTINA